jgi:hypothetical protein
VEKSNTSELNLSKLIPKIENLTQIGRSKQLAQFGDSVTNVAYSMAKSKKIGRLVGAKVNRKILSNAYKNAGLKPYANLRADAHSLADSAEAFIGFAYLSKSWTIEIIAQYLYESLRSYEFANYKEEIDGAIEAFTNLLEKIKADIPFNKQ